MEKLFLPIRLVTITAGFRRTSLGTMLLLLVLPASALWTGDSLWMTVALVLVCYWSLGLIFLVRQDMQSLVDSLGQLASDNPEQPVTCKPGPMSELLTGLATLTREHDRHRQQQTNRLVEIAYSANELQRSSDELASNTNRQSDATASGASALVEMTQGVDNIAQLIRETSVAAQEASDLATLSTRAIQSATQDIRAMDDCATRTSQMMEQLNEQSRVVHDITEVIREISDQTNLLALNAAIEAARAGNLGRGFAVVADEVRALARRSHQSADEISAQIQQVTQAIDNVAASMTEVRRLTTCSVESANEVDSSLQQIQAKTDEVSERVHAIASNTEQQSLAANEISQRIEEVHLAASSNSQRAEETARVAMHLAHLSQA